MKTPQTAREIHAALTNPEDICSAEYSAIHETITAGLHEVWNERETDDDARTWAISVCEEFIAHAEWVIRELSRIP